MHPLFVFICLFCIKKDGSNVYRKLNYLFFIFISIALIVVTLLLIIFHQRFLKLIFNFFYSFFVYFIGIVPP